MNTARCYNSESTVNAVLGAFQRYTIPEPCVVFVRRRQEAELVADALRCTWVHGGLAAKERGDIAERMRSGEILRVVCTDVWATGVDIPNIAAVVMAMGGSAPIGLKQRSGRGTRLFGAKDEFLIYDVPVRPDDAHQAARRQHYVDGGFEVEGYSRPKRRRARGERQDDEDLEAFVGAPRKDRPEAAPAPAPSPAPAPAPAPYGRSTKRKHTWAELDAMQAKRAAESQFYLPETELGRRALWALWTWIPKAVAVFLIIAAIIVGVCGSDT